MSNSLKVALLGCGTVGSQVAQVLLDQSDELKARVGREIELVAIAVRDINKPRPGIDSALLTADVEALLGRRDLDIVVELIGDIEPAGSYLRAALSARASVVTANKALLAVAGPSLFEIAEANKVDLYYEAAVAGAIPIIRPLRESLVGDQITSVKGIVNGTTNFILEKMYNDGADYQDVLAQAQLLGYAEADPTADVEGFDAAAKAAILAGLAFHTQVVLDDVGREGITNLSADDIAAAKDMGCTIKLLARCDLADDGSVSAGVYPTMVPLSHPLAGVHDAYNAIFVESRYAGHLMFMGKGAGGAPTASAVLGDIVIAARNRARGPAGLHLSAYHQRKIIPNDLVCSKFYVSMNVVDKPGVLAEVAKVFARHEVSLQAVRQNPDLGAARLGVMTHPARLSDLKAAVIDLETLDAVSAGVTLIRVEEE
ncbi:MAG: homoserine dehydrogenase [Propionibacteriaceae bacterium]|nr:homoserine dehydrogenase [Propionibacteriaceae bacterium]